MSRRPEPPPCLPAVFHTENRRRLRELLPPGALVVVNANDVLPTNADGTLRLQPNSDLLYLAGITQESSVLVLAPDASDPRQREMLFLREPSPRLATWEGPKLTEEQATKISGIATVKWLSDFPGEFHKVMCEAEHVFLNSNEHKRAVVEVETRDARFIRDCQERYPLHQYHRLARCMHRLRVAKTPGEIELIRYAAQVTGLGFRRILRRVRPGVGEHEIEAEFAHEFIRRRCEFAYPPIIASGRNSCILHYNANDRISRPGEVMLLDVAAQYRRYNSDLTRTLPVGGRFSRRQRRVYDAVLRVQRAMTRALAPGKRHPEWLKEAEAAVEKELMDLGLLTRSAVRRQHPDRPAFKRYYMHGVGHVLGLDVHDVGFMHEPMQAGWVFTVEPGIYIPDEGFGIRIENTVLLTDHGTEDLMADIPIEADDIEALMARPT